MNSRMQDQTSSRFIAEYRLKHGRSPRVLHIGNIANNAYLNAKILNEAGCDCDVICYDYYHIMGCPEWEEADFDATGLNHFRPEWSALDLNGFERPRWFAQGPQLLCMEYLIAKRVGDLRRAAALWKQLGYENGTLGGGSSASYSIRLQSWGEKLKARAMRALVILKMATLESIWIRLGVLAEKYGALGFLLLAFFVAPVVILIAISVRILRRAFHPLGQVIGGENSGDDFDFNRVIAMQVRHFAESFPERADKLSANDCVAYSGIINSWRHLFKQYDIILAYSTDGVLPLLANVPYIAFEHGTIRDIPYEATTQGRLAAQTYRLAKHVMVTNFDCQNSAEFLAPGRYTLINHPFDEDHGLAVSKWEELRQELRCKLESNFLFFFPTRQDWIPGTGYADKANNVFLQAFIRLRSKGYSVGLVCCAWGSNVEQSKALIKEFNCDKYVEWVDPMAIVPFERTALACECIVDQFKLGAFGGVLFKAMAVGAPVLTYLDENRVSAQYPEIPPVINCKTEDDVFNNVVELINDPEYLASRGYEGRKWIKQYHSKVATVNAQIELFGRLLPL